MISLVEILAAEWFGHRYYKKWGATPADPSEYATDYCMVLDCYFRPFWHCFPTYIWYLPFSYFSQVKARQTGLNIYYKYMIFVICNIYMYIQRIIEGISVDKRKQNDYWQRNRSQYTKVLQHIHSIGRNESPQTGMTSDAPERRAVPDLLLDRHPALCSCWKVKYGKTVKTSASISGRLCDFPHR